MKLSQIEKIESEFDVSLPDEYRKLLLDCPGPLIKLLSSEPDPKDRPVFLDAGTIRRKNKHVRSWDDEFTWKNRYFIVGASGCGDYYCLNTGRAQPTFHFWDHESCKYLHYAKSFDQFVRKVFDHFAYLTLDQLNFVHIGEDG